LISRINLAQLLQITRIIENLILLEAFEYPPSENFNKIHQNQIYEKALTFRKRLFKVSKWNVGFG